MLQFVCVTKIVNDLNEYRSEKSSSEVWEITQGIVNSHDFLPHRMPCKRSLPVMKNLR